jgi:hypothetical protein
MVNLADLSPLVKHPVSAEADAAGALAAAAAFRDALRRCNSVLHHEILDYKHRQLHELWAGVEALQQLVHAALSGEQQQVCTCCGRTELSTHSTARQLTSTARGARLVWNQKFKSVG